MNKLFASVAIGSLLFMACMSEARADDGANAVISERRALKPGTGTYVVDTTIDVRISRWLSQGGWQPASIDFDLWGKSDSANAIAVKWKDGNKVITTMECEAPDIDEAKDMSTGHFNDQAKVHCQASSGTTPAVTHTGTFEAEIYLRAAGKPEQLLRKVSFAVGSMKENDTPNARTMWFVDHDYKLAEVVGYWDWDAGSLHLRAYTKQSADIQNDGKLRCTQDGKPIAKDGVVQPGGGMGLAVDGVKPTYWVQLEGIVWLPRTSGKWTPGKYECQMIVSAKVMRTIRFSLDSKLGFVTSAEQQGTGAIASRTTFLPDFDIPTGIDQPFSRSAFVNLAMSGRPWKNVPVAVISASNIGVPSAGPSAPAAAEKTATTKKGKPAAKPKGKGKTAKR